MPSSRAEEVWAALKRVYSMDLSRKRQQGEACIEKDDDVQREGALRRCLRSFIAMTAANMVASMRMVA
jgi:hypothetical protein